MVNIKLKQEYVIIPITLIKDVFPSTNAVFIKVYLHILMLSTLREEIKFSTIANDLQLLESDVMQAVKFWEAKGVFEMWDSDASESPASASNTASIPTVGVQKSQELNAGEVGAAITSNEALSEMIRIAQEVFGRPLSGAETKSLYWMHDSLRFSPEVILMLLEYCVSIKKTSMNYIERVATEWDKNGINTIELVEEFLQNQEERQSNIGILKRSFGIHERSLTTIEENYINEWIDKYGMSIDMIILAYENCVLRTNRLSFQYMDKIIQQWAKKEIRDVSTAKAEMESFKGKGGNQDFDLLHAELTGDELEQITRENLKKEFTE